MLDGFAKAFKEAKEARMSDSACSLDPEAVGISEFQSLQSQSQQQQPLFEKSGEQCGLATNC